MTTWLGNDVNVSASAAKSLQFFGGGGEFIRWRTSNNNNNNNITNTNNNNNKNNNSSSNDKSNNTCVRVSRSQTTAAPSKRMKIDKDFLVWLSLNDVLMIVLIFFYI